MGLFTRATGSRRKQPEPLFDPHEFGAARSDPGLGAFEPLPPSGRRINNKKLLTYFFCGVVLIAIFRASSNPAPSVKASCTEPAYALSKTEVKSYGTLKWSAAGPTGSSVVFGVDTTTVPGALDEGLLSGPTALKACRASGLFGVGVPEGDHTLTAFLVAADGTAKVIGTEKLVVDAP